MEIIVGKTAGFCNGIKRAVDGCYEELTASKKVYCLGEIAHNKQVITNLEEKGLQFIDSLEQITEPNAKVLFRAHGVTKEVYEIAHKKNLQVIDYTCPKVLAIHQLVENYQKEGYYIFLTGESGHPEVVGTLSFCYPHVFLIETISDVEKAINCFQQSHKNKLLLVSQTTFHLEKFEQIKNKIENLLPKNIPFIIQNTICMATQVRQNETKKVASEVEQMIIIGGKNSSNTQKLYEIALANCKNTIFIQTCDQLKNVNFHNIQKVGIMAGASTPQKSIEDVVTFLKSVQNERKKG